MSNLFAITLVAFLFYAARKLAPFTDGISPGEWFFVILFVTAIVAGIVVLFTSLCA